MSTRPTYNSNRQKLKREKHLKAKGSSGSPYTEFTALQCIKDNLTDAKVLDEFVTHGSKRVRDAATKAKAALKNMVGDRELDKLLQRIMFAAANGWHLAEGIHHDGRMAKIKRKDFFR